MHLLQSVVEMESLGVFFKIWCGNELCTLHPNQYKVCHLFVLETRLHSPVEVSQLFKCLLMFVVNITIDLVCVCDGIVQYVL